VCVSRSSEKGAEIELLTLRPRSSANASSSVPAEHERRTNPAQLGIGGSCDTAYSPHANVASGVLLTSLRFLARTIQRSVYLLRKEIQNRTARDTAEGIELSRKKLSTQVPEIRVRQSEGRPIGDDAQDWAASELVTNATTPAITKCNGQHATHAPCAYASSSSETLDCKEDFPTL
jgi:hypothetical protein